MPSRCRLRPFLVVCFLILMVSVAPGQDATELEFIELGFMGERLRISPSRKFAVIIGRKKMPKARRSGVSLDHMAIVDLENRKVIGRKKIPQGIVDVACDDKYVFYIPNSGELFYRFDHSLEQGERKFLSDRPSTLVLASPTRLIVVTHHGKQSFNIETLQSDGAHSLPLHHSGSPKVNIIGSKYFWENHRYIDIHSGRVVRVESHGAIPSAVNSWSGRSNRNRSNTKPHRWGRRLDRGRLATSNNEQVAEMKDRVGFISETLPVAIVAGIENGRTSRIYFHDLITGEQKHAVTLGVAMNVGSASLSERRAVVTENHVVMIYGQELLFAAFPKRRQETFESPPHFTIRQPTMVPVGKTESVQLGVEGKPGELVFTLMTEYPGLEFDTATGELKIDTVGIWEQFCKKMFHLDDNTIRLRANEQSLNLDPMFKNNENAFQQIFERQLPNDKMVAAIPIHATLSDDKRENDEVAFTLFLVGPKKPIIETKQNFADQLKANKGNSNLIINMEQLKKEQAEFDKKRARDPKHQRNLDLAAQRREQQRAKEQQSSASKKSYVKRLSELESRMRKVEAVMDSVLARLDEIKDSLQKEKTEK